MFVNKSISIDFPFHQRPWLIFVQASIKFKFKWTIKSSFLLLLLLLRLPSLVVLELDCSTFFFPITSITTLITIIIMFSSLPLLALLVIVALSPFDLVLGASRLNRPAGRRSSRSSGPVSNNNVCQKDVCLKAGDYIFLKGNFIPTLCIFFLALYLFQTFHTNQYRLFFSKTFFIYIQPIVWPPIWTWM